MHFESFVSQESFKSVLGDKQTHNLGEFVIPVFQVREEHRKYCSLFVEEDFSGQVNGQPLTVTVSGPIHESVNRKYLIGPRYLSADLVR